MKNRCREGEYLLYMGFYQLSKEERQRVVLLINSEIEGGFRENNPENIIKYFSNTDTYIRKNAYLAVGRIYRDNTELQQGIIRFLAEAFNSKEEKVRQTVIYSAGEIGIIEFDKVSFLLKRGLFDEHHSVRNAVIGAMKNMGQKNPIPILSFSKEFLHHPDKEVRRQIVHGLELRGRTHPEDILPLLKELEFDKSKRVQDTLIHVIGQISYKKGCLEKVIAHLKNWENKEVVEKSIEEIIDTHLRYKNFSYKTCEEAKEYIRNNIFEGRDI